MSLISESIAVLAEAVPQHVAIIMDGNGRWANERGLERLEGHKAGALTVRKIVEEARRLGVRYLTLFSFSTENWGRPLDEVNGLMRLFAQYLASEMPTLERGQVALRAIGDLSRLPVDVRESLARTSELTANFKGMDLILALSYGGREEITAAARVLATKVKNGELTPEQINNELFAQHLYTADIPDPDLLIRTSGEERISNFLLWQLAYAEIMVVEELWPEFDEVAFQRCLAEFSRRERRFGLSGEQIRANAKNGSVKV